MHYIEFTRTSAYIYICQCIYIYALARHVFIIPAAEHATKCDGAF